MTRNTLLRLGLALLIASALALLGGCGGDDDGLSAEDMARLQAAEDRAAAAEMAAEEAGMAAEEAAMAAEEAGMVTPAPTDDPDAKDDVQPDADQPGLAVAVRVEHSVNGPIPDSSTLEVDPKTTIKNDVQASEHRALRRGRAHGADVPDSAAG